MGSELTIFVPHLPTPKRTHGKHSNSLSVTTRTQIIETLLCKIGYDDYKEEDVEYVIGVIESIFLDDDDDDDDAVEDSANNNDGSGRKARMRENIQELYETLTPFLLDLFISSVQTEEEAREVIDRIMEKALKMKTGTGLGALTMKAIRSYRANQSNKTTGDGHDDNDDGDYDDDDATDDETAYDGDIPEFYSVHKDCLLCERVMPLTFHHVYPKGTHAKVKKMHRKDSDFDPQVLLTGIMICRPCHSQIHRIFDNMEMAEHYNSVEAIRSHAAVQKWVGWASKQAVRIKR